MDEQRKLLERESTSGESCCNDNKGFRMAYKLSYRAVVGLGGLISNLKNVLLWVKCYKSALHATMNLFVKGRVNLYGKLHCYFKKLSQPPPP